MEGDRVGKLYKLHMTPMIPDSQAMVVNTTMNLSSDITLWHQRMGHVNIQTMKKMSEMKILADFTIDKRAELPQICSGCAFGKQHRATYVVDPEKQRSQTPGELLHADLCGKMTNQSLGGAKYYLLIKDDCTSFRFIYFLTHKDEAL